MYVSSTAALGDLASNETIITEEIEWNPEKNHSDYAISKYGAEMEIRSARRVRCNNCKSRNYYCPGFQEQGSGQLLRRLLTDYGITPWERAFVAVSDVVCQLN
jgi:nucleoside-diphosphate-sugar epimerase